MNRSWAKMRGPSMDIDSRVTSTLVASEVLHVEESGLGKREAWRIWHLEGERRKSSLKYRPPLWTLALENVIPIQLENSSAVSHVREGEEIRFWTSPKEKGDRTSDLKEAVWIETLVCLIVWIETLICLILYNMNSSPNQVNGTGHVLDRKTNSARKPSTFIQFPHSTLGTAGRQARVRSMKRLSKGMILWE